MFHLAYRKCNKRKFFYCLPKKIKAFVLVLGILKRRYPLPL